jgi:hypothetical protein
LETKPSFRYMSPGVSKYWICTFLIPSSLSYSYDLNALMISDVVAAFGETAEIWWASAPKSCDFPALTGPISPTLRVYAFYGEVHLPLYLLLFIISSCYIII